MTMTKMYLENVEFNDYVELVKKLKKEIGYKIIVHYDGNDMNGNVKITPLCSNENIVEFKVIKILNDFYQEKKKKLEEMWED